MSLALDDQKIGWSARLEQWGDDLTWLNPDGNKFTFRGTVLPIDAAQIEALLGQDIRETDQLQVESDGMLNFTGGSIIQRGSDKWRIVKRVNSNADFIAIFSLIKITSIDS